MALLVLLMACDGTTGDTGDTAAAQADSFAAIQEELFVPFCGSVGCHGAASAAGGLVLEGADAYENLVMAPCTNDDAGAMGLYRVTPGDPSASFLFLKITDPMGLGDPMPPWNLLPQGDQARIERWILDGAPE